MGLLLARRQSHALHSLSKEGQYHVSVRKVDKGGFGVLQYAEERTLSMTSRGDITFTIAIPTYNNESTVGGAISSSLAQDYQGHYEVLVVNNCSTDGTLAVINRWADEQRLRVVSNEATVSLYENHNICLGEARGRYVLFCHSDDTLDPSALNILHRKIESRGFPDRYILWGHSLYADFYRNICSAGFNTGQLFCGIEAVKPFFSNGLTASGTCYSKSFSELGGFLLTDQTASPADASTMVLAALRGYRFEMLQDILFVREGASTGISGRPWEEWKPQYEDAFSKLFARISQSEFNKLLKVAEDLKHTPWLFYYAASAVEPERVAKRVFRSLLRRPFVLRRKNVRSCAWGVFGNYFRRGGVRA